MAVPALVDTCSRNLIEHLSLLFVKSKTAYSVSEQARYAAQVSLAPLGVACYYVTAMRILAHADWSIAPPNSRHIRQSAVPEDGAVPLLTRPFDQIALLQPCSTQKHCVLFLCKEEEVCSAKKRKCALRRRGSLAKKRKCALQRLCKEEEVCSAKKRKCALQRRGSVLRPRPGKKSNPPVESKPPACRVRATEDGLEACTSRERLNAGATIRQF